MARRLLLLVSLALAAAVAAAASIGPVSASTPSEGTLSGSGTVSWTGGPFQMSNPAPCLVLVGDLCDEFSLTVDAPAGTSVQITVAADSPGDDLDIQIIGADGTLVSFQRTPTNPERASLTHTDARSPYSVRVQPTKVAPGATYHAAAVLGPKLNDPEQDCLEAVPHQAGVQGITDDGAVIELSVRVLVDAPPDKAAATMAAAQDALSKADRPYADVGVHLAPSFEPVQFSGTTSAQLFAETKAHVGGVRPPGIDVVYLLTTKDFDDTTAGIADCIGGVEYPDRAFALGELSDSFDFGPFTFQKDATAKIAAHEIEHLMGAHHHYGTCERTATDPDAENPEPCTLMVVDIALISLEFSKVEAAVVRGHANAYARP